MVVEYQISFEDFMALQKDYVKRGKIHRIKANILFVLLTAMVFLSGIIVSILVLPQSAYLMSFTSYQLLPIFIGIILAALMIRPVKKFYAFAIGLQLKFMLRNDKRWPHDVILHIHETFIDLTVIREKMNTTTKIAWESIKMMGEDGKNLYLYYEEAEAIIVPKSNPALNESENRILHDLINQHLNRHVVNEK
jgi:hypothetical protein